MTPSPPAWSEVEDVLAKSDLNGYDLDEATKEVFKGFSSAYDDKYFEYLDPSRYASFVKDSSDGAYNGVGVLFSDYNGRALVSDVFSGSAAEAAGVQQGDVLVGIDGDTSHDWSVTEAISGLSRNAGETGRGHVDASLFGRRRDGHLLHHRAHVLFV